MKEIYERWESVSERWDFTDERFENGWWGWVRDQINDRFYPGPWQPFSRIRGKVLSFGF